MKILWLPQISLWFLSTLSLLQRFYPRLLSKRVIFPKKVNSLGNMLQGQALINCKDNDNDNDNDDTTNKDFLNVSNA